MEADRDRRLVDAVVAKIEVEERAELEHHAKTRCQSANKTWTGGQDANRRRIRGFKLRKTEGMKAAPSVRALTYI